MASSETEAATSGSQDDSDDKARSTESPDHMDHSTDKRARKLTEKGLVYQQSVKEKNFHELKKKLKETLDKLDMNWTDLSDPEMLRRERASIEECRKALEEALPDYVSLLESEESHQVTAEADYLGRLAVELRRKVGERIFELEKEELRSRRSERSSPSKQTGRSRTSKLSNSSQLSVLKMKTMTELARKEVEMKYAKLESEKKMELERKKCEMEEIQRLRSYETAKAEADLVVKMEEEEKNPNLADLNEFQMTEDDKQDRVRNYVFSLSAGSSASSQHPLPYSFQPVAKDHHPASPPQGTYATNTKLPSETFQVPSIGQNSAPSQQGKLTTPPPVSRATNTNCVQPEFSTVPFHLSTPRAEQSGIAEAIAEGMEAARLPTPHLTIFSGNPLNWPSWKAAFETVIEKRTINSQEKILYLLQYLSGAPKKIVEGYQFVQTDDAYTEAKKTLERRFGHPSVVAEAFRKKLETWPRIPSRDGFALREFGDFLKTCELAMRSVEDLETLNKQHENKLLIKILPSWAHPKWGARVRDHQIKHGDGKFPPFTKFVQFVTEIAEVQCLPVLTNLDSSGVTMEERNKTNQGRYGSHRGKPANALATRAGERVPHSPSQGKGACYWCGNLSHGLNSCFEFSRKPIKQRTQFIIRKGLCLSCLAHGHMAKENKCETTPRCTKCKNKHLTCLHDDSKAFIKNTGEVEYRPPNTTVNSEVTSSVENRWRSFDDAAVQCTSVCSIEGQQLGQDQSLIIPVWVSTSENTKGSILTYALIDSQSNATFITEQLRKSLNIDGIESHLRLSTMHKEDELVECKKVQGLLVTDLKQQVTIPLPKVYTRDTIPYKPSQIPKPEVAMQWDHLRCIAKDLMQYREDLQVGLLIGTNCPKAIKPREVIPGSDNDPYGIKTDLGWGIVGRVCKSSTDEDLEESGSWVNKIVTKEDVSFAIESRTKELISPNSVREMFERDFHEQSDHNDSPSLSVEDRQFLEILDTRICQREDGHYEMPLPLRSQDVKLPNNRSQALRRLSQLKARFKRDPKYHKDYSEFMEDMIKNCAEGIPSQDKPGIKIENGKINYVPHHGVYHPRKPLQIRVVFDCSANYQGTSLNKNLLQGPDMTNNLLGVLCRFRQEVVALTCDVKGMFHQFFVSKDDRDLLRFLWWHHGDLKNEPQEFRMKVHLFGAASSPGCANYGFKRAAEDGEKEFGSEAADFIHRNFYVDDGLKSVQHVDSAISLIQNCKAMCAKAGLKLHKFSSNKKEVIQAIPTEDRAKGFQELDLTRDPLPIERTLGIVWCAETDSFQFRIVIQDRPLTRRGILSTVCSVYDPLGFAAPLILVGKQILQELCRDNADWDEPISDYLRPRWERWRNELHVLESLKIPRCYRPEDFGEVTTVELHHFSDASRVGYGQCSYLRLLNADDQPHCSFVMGKARVTPLRPMTIPRLELTAAVISVRMSKWLGRELDYQDVTEFFWTDSKVVIGYINNSARRFHTFVANRVQEIHSHTKPQQWDYVDTRSNPADAASRGLSAQQLVDDDSHWLRGPDLLWKSGTHLNQAESNPRPLDSDDPEVKKVSTLVTQTDETHQPCFGMARLDRFSDWFRAKRAIAVCLRLKRAMKERKVSKSSVNNKPRLAGYQPVSLKEIDKAETEIIHCLQQEHFQEEIKTLLSVQATGEFDDRKKVKQRNSNLKKCSSLYRLDPYLDTSGTLRVGGRLRRANISDNAKHPVILPRRSHVTSLILQHCHQVIKHQGSGMTHNEARQRGYWIIGGASAVANLVSRCVVCRKLRAPLQQQKLADLPEDRVEPAAPFTYSAVDYFGPFVIKEGRKEIKRYGVLFTCMASRAIHIETANSLETDAFINALRRFQAERGPVRQLRSDRGTNFIGARRELTEGLEEMDKEKIRNHLLEENCEWIDFKMNPPSASHMGGSWERQIRTVRNVLAALLEESGRQLDDESFRTLMKEVQAIVNARPLALNDLSNTDEPQPLTPNHLLTMKSKVLMPPPGIFMREDLYLRKRWRRVQHLANEFWDRWRKEFLQTLQLRKKWVKPQRNIQIDDIVMVKDENSPRNAWRLARVEETFPSDDGLVRKVRLAMATQSLDKQGRRISDMQYLERPVHKLVLIQGGPEFSDEEPTTRNM